MTFHDLKLPKELSKKKKLELYKCWILTPLEKGSDQRTLNIAQDYERMGLNEKALKDELTFYMQAILDTTGVETSHASDLEVIDFIHQVSPNLKILDITNFGVKYSIGFNSENLRLIIPPMNLILSTDSSDESEKTQ